MAAQRGYLKDPTKPMNDALMAEIARGMAMKGKKEADICKYVGFSTGTWFNRKKHPGDFTLDETRRIVKATGASNEVILAMYGRRLPK